MSDKAGPSPAYKDLLTGRISPEEFVKKLRREANERLNIRHPAHEPEQHVEHRAAAG